MMFDSGSLHNCIGNMAGFYFTVYRYREVGNRAVPDVMITFTSPH
jgi:hypothetical protein